MNWSIVGLWLLAALGAYGVIWCVDRFRAEPKIGRMEVFRRRKVRDEHEGESVG